MTTIQIKDIYDAINSLREEIRECYVTKDEFKPVKLLVFGLVSIFLTAIATAIAASVINAK